MLSRRWLFSWAAGLFAGALYGFGPFALSLMMYHNPLAGLTYTMVPWLFLPAAYWHRRQAPTAMRFCVRTVLAALPFVGIIGLFWLVGIRSIGPTSILPIHTYLDVKDFYGLILPLYYKAGSPVGFGLYHASIIIALMGGFVFYTLRRVAVVIPALAGLVLAFCPPVMNVSPLVWASLPILFLAVLSGVGFQALVSAGKKDSVWIVTCAVAASILTAFFAAMAIRIIFIHTTFELTMLMYGLTAAAMWITLFCARKFPRQHIPRWILLGTAMTVDLIFSARYLIDKLF